MHTRAKGPTLLPLAPAASAPARPGNLTITSSDFVPSIAPPGPYSMRMQAWDQNSTAVMCIDIWFRVVSGPSAAAADSAKAPGSAKTAAGGRAAAAWRQRLRLGGGSGGERASGAAWPLLREALGWLQQL
jgi:hypothetical protein